MPRALPRGRQPQVGGQRGAHLRRWRGAFGARRRGGGGGHVVGPPRLLPGTPLSPPLSVLLPLNVGLLGEKFGCGSGTPSAAPRRPALLPPPAAAPARCPPGVRGGAGPARWGRGGPRRPLPARCPAPRGPSRPAPGVPAAVGRGAAAGRRAALPGEEGSGVCSSEGARQSPVSRGLLSQSPPL